MAAFRRIRSLLGLRRASSGPAHVTAGRHTYGWRRAIHYAASADAPITIGAFCSINGNAQILGAASHHRLEAVSTFPLATVFSDFPVEPLAKKGTSIGNDVWIGTQAVILAGVTIGDGAVIGAGAIVTKNVPPYAIVGGNPAAIIRYRFSPGVVDQILAIQWWRWSDKKICRYRDAFAGSIEAFIAKAASDTLKD